MDAIASGAVESMAADQRDLMEEELATRLLLVALIRHLVDSNALSSDDLTALVRRVDDMINAGPLSPPEEKMFADRMRARLAQIGELLGVRDPQTVLPQ